MQRQNRGHFRAMPAFDSNALETPVRLAITDWHMLFPLILIAGQRTISLVATRRQARVLAAQ